MDLSEYLHAAEQRHAVPTVLAYNRIDGPGSSLDLREFQQALWALRQPQKTGNDDLTMQWTRTLPRTVGITIDTGTRVEAKAYKRGYIEVRSLEYGTEVSSASGRVVPTKENWLLKIVDAFSLSGVTFSLENSRAGIQSAGLGGSATATSGVCILANALAGHPFAPQQLISMASRMEQDLGVSITGTQEQSNVFYGGVVDYVWFPWGIPGRPDSSFGSSLRTELLSSDCYLDLEARLAIFHSGHTRPSTDVNAVWRDALSTPKGFELHSQKLEIAYQFRESLRLQHWDGALEAIRKYREIRTELCRGYMEGATEILGRAEAHGGSAFPLGAGGGGGILVFAPDPHSMVRIKRDLDRVYREIPFSIRDRGHELINVPEEIKA